MDAKEKEETTNNLRFALTAIAKEVKRYHDFPTSSNQSENERNYDLDSELKALKSRIRLKKIQIRLLKKNLKTACVIAKTVVSAKESETLELNKHITLARQESVNLFKKAEESSEVIQKLTVDNQGLSDKLENIHNFIELGFQELKKMRNEIPEDASTVMKLKHIMLCCGQYYADYCNEHERCQQLERRNRFLTNKLNILENNLETATGELNNLKLHKGKNIARDKKSKSETQNIQRIGYITSENQFGQEKKLIKIASENIGTVRGPQSYKPTSHKIPNLDLTSHLLIVKDLLKDQDSMLKEMKELSLQLEICDASEERALCRAIKHVKL